MAIMNKYFQEKILHRLEPRKNLTNDLVTRIDFIKGADSCFSIAVSRLKSTFITHPYQCRVYQSKKGQNRGQS